MPELTVARADGTTTALPVDVTLISETISLVLASRDWTPDRTVCAAWHRWLAGHLRLLAPIAVEQAPHWSDPEHMRLVEVTAAAVAKNLEGGLPADRHTAYVHVQELARECLGLLGLVLDQPRGGR
ncbi:DUF6415 family natural product biosynthesis protein [Streptomyces sp. NBC_00513]|uniref:DUF6415 family natural product biosynthesis protein n=1 Tax=unclassified Streptomyces TaxID=2593676 RepID=UPI0022590DFB|nr:MULTISPECIES: DUF6415 family natural product biosynthesis protein [unclassified Streptomyces]MCX5078646.1 DUF6415 family natural product biosynthesis protein [Streptomyces sp. NBC_00424]WUD39089.1 DUF6415 family natural product biosynthesis protein [Streptomyces sp. NBC_00513]WUD45640.1 DUF6415 family natural product biosynthesis protein [Streptomyces sp. NBC_00513]